MYSKKEITDLLIDESFQRWMAGTALPAEVEPWQAWLGASSAHAQLLSEARSLWQAAQFQSEPAPEIEPELQRLQTRLALAQKPAATIRSLESRRANVDRALKSLASWKALGMFAIAAGIGLAILWPKAFAPEQPANATQTFTTAWGERLRLKLPDGTNVMLNARSTLRHASSWSEAIERRVELQGEAYFDVVAQSLPGANGNQAFVVQTRDGAMTVLGTKFVVYERNVGTRVAVEEGRVLVQAGDTTAARLVLTAGQLVNFQRNELALTPENKALGFHTTWWQEEWQLEATPFAEIMHRLEETYGVRVEVSEAALRERTLSGTIDNRDFESVITALAKALRLRVQRSDEVVKFESIEDAP